MKAIQFDTPAKGSSILKLAVISDGHVDSPFFDTSAFISIMNGIKAEKRFVIVNGDLLDAILRTDIKRGANHLMERTDDQLNQKIKRVVELLKPYQENILFVGRGNHKASCLKFNGVDVLDIICEMLNAKSEHKIICGNYSNWLRFNWHDSKGKSVAHYDVYMHHGVGSSASVTKGMIDFDRLASSVNADLVIIGHKHNAIVDYSHPLQKLTANGDFVLKNRIFLQTPSFQVPRKLDQNDNFNEKFYTNQAMAGYASIDLTLKSSHNNHYRIIPDVKLVIKPEHTVGNLEIATLKKKIDKTR